jgi:hypothetical protein
VSAGLILVPFALRGFKSPGGAIVPVGLYIIFIEGSDPLLFGTDFLPESFFLRRFILLRNDHSFILLRKDHLGMLDGGRSRKLGAGRGFFLLFHTLSSQKSMPNSEYSVFSPHLCQPPIPLNLFEHDQSQRRQCWDREILSIAVANTY